MSYEGGLPFPIRGTEDWNQRERWRMALGHSCLSFGTVYDGQNAQQVGYIIKEERKKCLEKKEMAAVRAATVRKKKS